MNYEALRNSISAAIKTNGEQRITGAVLQEVLLNMVSSLGQFASYAGIANPGTNPAGIDGNVFYIATAAGNYQHFGFTISTSGYYIISNLSGVWNLVRLPIAADSATYAGGISVSGYNGVEIRARKIAGDSDDIELYSSDEDFRVYVYGAEIAQRALSAADAYNLGGIAASMYLTKSDAAATYQPLITATNKLPYSLLSGTPTSLPASDVYPWAKAATKPTYTFSEITGKPTTLSGYGITDAYTKNDINRGYFPKMEVCDYPLKWSDGYRTGSVSLIESGNTLFSTNRLMFVNPEGITIEYSRDNGTTWNPHPLASDAVKTMLVSNYPVNLYLAGTTENIDTIQDRLRVTLDFSSMGLYARCQRILVEVSNTNENAYVLVEAKLKNGSYKEIVTAPIRGWSGWNSYNLNNAAFGSETDNSYYTHLRLTFFIDRVLSGYKSFCLSSLYLLGTTLFAGNNIARTGNLYSYDHRKYVFFPGEIYALNDKRVLHQGNYASYVPTISQFNTLSGSVAANTTNISNIVNGTAVTKYTRWNKVSAPMDYIRFVIPLCRMEADQYTSGSVIGGRDNGIFSMFRCDYIIQKNYSQQAVYFGLKITGYKNYLRRCTFTYDGKAYAGLCHWIDSNSAWLMGIDLNFLTDISNQSEPSVISVYNSQTQEIFNQEIYDSLSIDGDDLIDIDLTYNGKNVAFTESNGAVASANKLATPRTIWGQSFDGSGNVSGNVTGSNFLLMDRSDNPYLRLTDTGGTVYFQNVNGVAYMGSMASRSLVVDKQGNVGIGTIAPAYTLDVVGTGRFTGNLTVSTINGGTPITSSNIASQSVAQANTANSVAWIGVTGKPTTLAGYGITDAISTSNIGSQTVAQALELTDSNGNVTYTAEDITAIDNKFANYSPLEGSASLTKYSGGNFGNAAAKNYTTSVRSGNANLVTSGAVYTAIDNLRQEVRVAFPSMATLSAYSLNGSTLNCYIESEDNIDLWSDLSAGAVLFVVIQDGASVEGTFNKISAKYDGSSDTTEIAVRQSPGLYSGYGCVLVSTGSLDMSQGGLSIVYPVAAS